MECQLKFTQCGKRYPLHEPRLRCHGCGEPLAAAKKLIGNGYLKPEDRIVLLITGAGLKVPSALEHLDAPAIFTCVGGLTEAIGKVIEGLC